MATISSKQEQILRFPYTKYDALICDGAVRSGKTSIMSLSFFLWAMNTFNNCAFAFCGKSVGAVERNVVVPLLSVRYLQENFAIRYNRGAHLITVRRGNRENRFYLFGGRDESSYTLIQGVTLAGVMLDEVALMPRSFVEQALARCSVENAKLWFNCNPESPQHWFYTEWIKKAEEKNALLLHFLMSDNPSLSEQTLQRYESMYTGVFYDRYIKGLWVIAEGLIYPLFADNPQRYEVTRDELPAFKYITVGVDFGGNKSAYAFVATGLTEDWDVCALRSLRIPAKGVSVEQMIARFVRFCEGIEQDYGAIDFVYPDNAEQAIINSMDAQTRWRIIGSVKGEIIDRIRTMDTLLSTDRFRYVSGECDSLKSALCEAVWDDKKLEDVRLDDGTSDIDTLDAWEYSFSAFLRQIVRR